MNFDEILSKELNEADLGNLRKLKNGSDWKILKDFVESHLIRWSYNLLMSNEDAAEELKSLRGFAKGWRLIQKLIDSK